MKLTYCQIGKFFLLLTAFFLLLDSRPLMGVLCAAKEEEEVAIERSGSALNAAAAAGELTSATKITGKRQTTANSNVTAVQAVIVAVDCRTNNNNKESVNNCGSNVDIAVNEKRQQQEIQQRSAIKEVNKLGVVVSGNANTILRDNTTKLNDLLHATTIRQNASENLNLTLETADLQKPQAERASAQATQNQTTAHLDHKLITTIRATKLNKISKTKPAVLVGATTKDESIGKIKIGKHVAEIYIATTTETTTTHTQQSAEKSTEQQVQQPHRQQYYQAEPAHQPRQQFDTIRLPIIVTKTTAIAQSASSSATEHSSTLLGTEKKKLEKFAAKMSKQQLEQRESKQKIQQQQQQHEQQREKYQQNSSKDVKSEKREVKVQNSAQQETAQKPLEVALEQARQQIQIQTKKLQQRHNQQGDAQQLLNIKPLPARNEQPQQQNHIKQPEADEQLQQDIPHVSPLQQTKRTRKQQQHSNGREKSVGVLIPSRILDVSQVQLGFHIFLEFFHVNLQNVSVDFIRDDDLSGFIKFLEHPKYTTVVKTLNAGINFAADELPWNGEATVADASTAAETVITETEARQSQRRQAHQQQQSVTPTYINNATVTSFKAGEMRKSSTSSNSPLVAYCQLAEQLSRDYNKTVLIWPCPQMKESSNFLPSFEAISFAVKSIATKLNWTHVDIYVGDENWGMPLAIAANLHIPYKIEIGEDIRDMHALDKIGHAIIVTADMNDASTLHLLTQLAGLQHTKVLLIDVVATSFNAENNFYKNLARINASSELMSNLLLLTVLSDKYRHFLKVAFEDNGIGLVQNFRQMRRWKAMTSD
ncbi:AF4/FMR2 family member 4, partial [Ceratitis capitata]|uniref:AF4/FMR2 family member 4 n=1 Tax=Ceratitis capitata TaxID=7213 RepID=UPI00061881BA